MSEVDRQIKRLKELATTESFSDANEHIAASREMAGILAGLPWEEWTEDEGATIDRFGFFILMEPAAVDGHAGALTFREAAIEAARHNPAAARLALEFPSHWTFIELQDLKLWIAARPRGLGTELADRLRPSQAKNLVPPPNVDVQLEILKDIITNFPDGRAAAAQAYGQWLTVRAEAGDRAADALRRTVDAIADLMRDEDREECAHYLLKLALMPSLEEGAVFEHLVAWRDGTPRLRAALALMVSEVYLDDAAPALRRLVADEIPDIREEAMRALVRIGEEQQFLEDDRSLAAEIIAIAAGHGAAPDLLETATKIFSKPA